MRLSQTNLKLNLNSKLNDPISNMELLVDSCLKLPQKKLI